MKKRIPLTKVIKRGKVSITRLQKLYLSWERSRLGKFWGGTKVHLLLRERGGLAKSWDGAESWQRPSGGIPGSPQSALGTEDFATLPLSGLSPSVLQRKDTYLVKLHYKISSCFPFLSFLPSHFCPLSQFFLSLSLNNNEGVTKHTHTHTHTHRNYFIM